MEAEVFLLAHTFRRQCQVDKYNPLTDFKSPCSARAVARVRLNREDFYVCQDCLTQLEALERKTHGT